MNSPTLTGKFVNLRPLIVDDADLTFRWRSAQRAKFLSRGASNTEEQARWINDRPPSEYNFIIELKNKHPVGMLSLCAIDLFNRHAEPGRFLIGDEEAAQGIPVAVEAMKLLYELAFDTLKLVRISGIVAQNNHLMIKWQKYLGMKEEGLLRKHLYQNGNYHDAVFLGLLEEEYRQVALPKMTALIAACALK